MFPRNYIEALRVEYAKIKTIDPESLAYQKLIALLDKMSQPMLKQLANEQINFVSSLARNRVKS